MSAGLSCLSCCQSLLPAQDELLLLPLREAEEEEGWFSHADPMCTWTAGTSRSAFILKLSIMLGGSHPGPELQNWHLGRCSAVKTGLAGQLCHRKKNALTFLFLKGKVNGRGWINSQAFSVGIWLSYALLLDGYQQVWPTWIDLVQMGMGRLLHLQTIMSLDLASSVVLNCSLPVMCASPQQNRSVKRKAGSWVRAANFGDEVLIMMVCYSALRWELWAGVILDTVGLPSKLPECCDLGSVLLFRWGHLFEVPADLSLMIWKWN